jgi:hypothetical protein
LAAVDLLLAGGPIPSSNGIRRSRQGGADYHETSRQEALVIEWVPRHVENGWRHVRPSPYRGPAVVEAGPEGPVVRVPVLVEDWARLALERAARRMVVLLRLAFFSLLLLTWFVQETARGFANTWPAWAGALLVIAVAAYRLVRLRRWRRGRRADLLLSPEGVSVDGIVVPWHQVERVVRFHFRAPLTRRASRAFLALQVSDFVAVRGLSPVEAGLANLTRRRLVVVAEAGQLGHPEELAAALDRLVADPDTRRLIATADGCRLLDEGPARVPRRYPPPPAP